MSGSSTAAALAALLCCAGLLQNASAAERAAAPAGRLAFCVYGDTSSVPRNHAQVVSAILGQTGGFAFALHLGDFVTEGGDEADWQREFLGPAAPLLAAMPLLPVRGNHDDESAIFDRRMLPPDRPAAAGRPCDYCVDRGPVRLVVFDCYAPARTGGARMKWLEECLAGAPDRWRLVAFHEPVWSTGKYHGPNAEFRRLVEPVLVRGRAHAVFSGHEHAYERTEPVNGVTHFTVPGAGMASPGGSWKTSEPWSARREFGLGFLAVTASPERLEIRAVKVADGEAAGEVDSVTIPFDCGWPASIAEPFVRYNEPAPDWRRRLLLAGLALMCLVVVVSVVRRKRRAAGLGTEALPRRTQSAQRSTEG